MGSAHRLERLLARRVRALAEHVPNALAGEPTAVHQARVASRRLREAVPVAGNALPRRKVRRLQSRLRRLTRLLGPLREHDVALEMVDGLGRFAKASAELFEAVKRDLARERAAGLALLGHHVALSHARRLFARLERLAAAIPDPGLVTGWREVLAERIRTRAHALHVAVADAGALYVAERLHAVRIAVKKLRYALELASEARMAPAGSLVRQLREMQDILGHLHDRDVLRARFDATLDVTDPRADLVDARAQVVAVLEADAHQLHARYLRRQATLIRVADRALDAVAPRVGVGGSAPR